MITEQFSAHYRIDFFLTRVGNEITLSLLHTFLITSIFREYAGNAEVHSENYLYPKVSTSHKIMYTS